MPEPVALGGSTSRPTKWPPRWVEETLLPLGHKVEVREGEYT
jgi:hypothetical protein